MKSNFHPIKNYDAGGTIENRRIVKFGTADHQVVKAAAATDTPIGVSHEPDNDGAPGAGDRIDVALAGIVEVDYGGAVTRGDLLTSDANGKAVAAAPGAGANNGIIGIAEISGVDGDIGEVRIAPQSLQG